MENKFVQLKLNTCINGIYAPYYLNVNGNKKELTQGAPYFRNRNWSQNLGIYLGLLGFDHYTLITGDAKACAAYHADVLGFALLRIQRVNTGTVPEGTPGTMLVTGVSWLTPSSHLQMFFGQLFRPAHAVTHQ